jgi:hypothetical protein
VTQETDDPTSDLRKIAINPQSGEVFVGGKNALILLNSKFARMGSISVGPRKHSDNCPPSKIHTCANATNTDNVVELLEYLPGEQKMLMCGSVQYGNCSLLNRTETTTLADNNHENYLGSRYGSIVVPFQKESDWVYFTGTSWDGRSSKHMPEEFSFKSYSDLEFFAEAVASKLSLCDHERRQSNLRFIYGFQDKSYVYAIYLKIRKEDGIDHFETKIARICKSDEYMGTFHEMTLKCHQHNIASAAYYSAKKHLYVTFGTGRGSLEARPSSVVCRFQDIVEQFNVAFSRCYNDLTNTGYSPPRWKNCRTDICKRDQTVSII